MGRLGPFLYLSLSDNIEININIGASLFKYCIRVSMKTLRVLITVTHEIYLINCVARIDPRIFTPL